jgi:hypothetical protein
VESVSARMFLVIGGRILDLRLQRVQRINESTVPAISKYRTIFSALGLAETM